MRQRFSTLDWSRVGIKPVPHWNDFLSILRSASSERRREKRAEPSTDTRLTDDRTADSSDRMHREDACRAERWIRLNCISLTEGKTSQEQAGSEDNCSADLVEDHQARKAVTLIPSKHLPPNQRQRWSELDARVANESCKSDAFVSD